MEMENLTTVTSWEWTSIKWKWWEVLQLIFALVGIFGNFLVMAVLFRVRKHRCSTDTLIAGLALADLLTSVFLIPYGEIRTLPDTAAAQFYCRIVHSSVCMWVCICASVFTLTAVSIERLVAVVWPFRFRQIFSPRNTLFLLLGIWVASFLVNLIIIFVVYPQDNTCVFGYPSVTLQKTVGVLVFLIEYFIPVVVMVCTYAVVIWSLHKRTRARPSQGDASRPEGGQDIRNKFQRAQRRIIMMFIAVVVTFIICWTPDQFFYFALNVGFIDGKYLYSPQYRSFVVLAFVNSCANPFIYAAWNPNFRRALSELFVEARMRRARPIFADKDSRWSNQKDLPSTSRTDMSSSSI